MRAYTYSVQKPGESRVLLRFDRETREFFALNEESGIEEYVDTIPEGYTFPEWINVTYSNEFPYEQTQIRRIRAVRGKDGRWGFENRGRLRAYPSSGGWDCATCLTRFDNPKEAGECCK